MITKQDAMNAKRFEHVLLKNADGTPLRARANGACKTWKTRPTEFKLPIKIGLYVYEYITHDECEQWNVA